MSEKLVGVPTISGIQKSFKDFGIGALGGFLFLIAYRIFGGLGVLAAPLLVGSMLKGDRSQIISTMAGFMLLAVGVMAVGSGSGSSNGSDEEM